MSFLQREFDAIGSLLRSTPPEHKDFQPLYAAQQAIAWAMEPDGYASPTALFHRQSGHEGGTRGTGIKEITAGMPVPSV